MKNKIWDDSEQLLGFERYGEQVYSRIDRLLTIRNEIGISGISKESYSEINLLYPNLLASINPNKITQYPSRTELSKVMGIIDTQSFISSVRDNTIVSLFMDFIDWVYRTIKDMFSPATVQEIKDTKQVTQRRAAKIDNDNDNVFREIEEHRSLDIYAPAVAASQKKYLSLGYNQEVVKYIHKLLLNCDVKKIPIYTQVLTRATDQDISMADVAECIGLINRCSLVDKYPVYATAMISGSGIPSAVLLRSYIGIDKTLVDMLSTISVGYGKISVELSRVPRIDTNVTHWLTGVSKELGRLNKSIASSKKLTGFITKCSDDETYYDTLSKIMSGHVGFWVTGKSKVQGSNCYNPVKNNTTLGEIFNPNNADYVDYANTISMTTASIELSLSTLKKIDINSTSEMIGNYNSNSATFRNIMRELRQNLAIYLKLARVVSKYVSACHELDNRYRKYITSYQMSLLKINL